MSSSNGGPDKIIHHTIIRINIWIFFFVSFNVSAQIEETKYFYCDFLGSVHKKTPHPSSLFNRLLHYKKLNQGHYHGNLGVTKPLEVKWHEPNILSSVHVETMGKQKGYNTEEFFYREVFKIYRINVQTGILIKSYVYYVSLEDYNRHFHPSLPQNNHTHAIPRNQKPLEFIERKAPKNYVKFGFEKSKWQCREISHSEYKWESIKKFFFQILSV